MTEYELGRLMAVIDELEEEYSPNDSKEYQYQKEKIQRQQPRLMTEEEWLELYRKKYKKPQRQMIHQPNFVSPSQQSLKLLPDVSRRFEFKDFQKRIKQTTSQSTASTAVTGLINSRPRILPSHEFNQISTQMADLQTQLQSKLR